MKKDEITYRRVSKQSVSSKTVSCPFCDFTCPSRGMSNHIGKVHGVRKVSEYVVPLSNKTKAGNQGVEINKIEQRAIEVSSPVIQKVVYSPCCLMCKQVIKGTSWSVFERSGSGNVRRDRDGVVRGKYSGEYRDTGDFICDKCKQKDPRGNIKYWQDLDGLKLKRVPFEELNIKIK
jgi:hypothetical protein